MTNKTIDELQPIAHLDYATVIEIFLKLDFSTLPTGEVLTLSQIIPNSIWSRLNQGRRGFFGAVFFYIHKDLGFEFAGRCKSDTTYCYKYTKNSF